MIHSGQKIVQIRNN